MISLHEPRTHRTAVTSAFTRDVGREFSSTASTICHVFFFHVIDVKCNAFNIFSHFFVQLQLLVFFYKSRFGYIRTRRPKRCTGDWDRASRRKVKLTFGFPLFVLRCC